jgi:hypothetical protein
VPLTVSLSMTTGRENQTVSLEPSGGAWTFDTRSRPRVEVNLDRGLLARMQKH